MRVVVRALRGSFRPGAGRPHRGHYHVALSVNGHSLGDRDQELGDGIHSFDREPWSVELADDGGRLAIVCDVRDGDAWRDRVERTRRPPYPSRIWLGGGGWALLLRIESVSQTRRPPRSVSVPRSTEPNGPTAVVLAPPPQLRFEIDPVIPLPDRPAARREAWTHWLIPNILNRNALARGFQPGRNLNPPVIARTQDARWAATVGYTRIWAPGLDEDELGPLTTWRVRSLAGGAQVRILGEPRGLSVRVLGSEADGEVAIDALVRGRRVATHRALVRRPVSLPARFNYYRVPERFRTVPRSQVPPGAYVPHGFSTRTFSDTYTEGHTTSTRNVANDYLRGLAIRIVPHEDRNPVDPSMRPIGEPGAFAKEATSMDEIFPPTREMAELVRVSAVPYVLNYVIVSDPGGDGGLSVLPWLHSEGRVTDDGEPSASLYSPSGVAPEGPARRQEIRCFDHHPRPELLEGLQGSTTHIVGALLRFLVRGDTVAHETGHLLGMRHRAPESDGLPNIPQNIMGPGGGSGDFDILQARVAWRSPLVHHWYRQAFGTAPPTG